MSSIKKTSRRQFLGQGALVASAGLALPMIVPRNVLGGDGQPTPNEQIGIGRIGNGRRANQHPVDVDNRARIVAVADVNRERCGPDGYQDYRKLLERKDVDAVEIATPEFWHYLPAIHACQAGKDVYAEQPLASTIREGRAIVEAARKYNRVYQVGEQQRSHGFVRKGCELVRNGRIGKVHTVLCPNYASSFYCDFPGQPVPEGMDWDMWCGPTEPIPYHQDIYLPRATPGWMSFYPYSGGELVNWGCHSLSPVMWGLGVSETGPVEVMIDPVGDKLDPPTYKGPESRERGDAACFHPIISYRFADGVVVKMDGGAQQLERFVVSPQGMQFVAMSGGTFIGDKGKISVVRCGYSCEPGGIDEEPLGDNAVRLQTSGARDLEGDGIWAHWNNFYDCIKTRQRPVMDVEYGHRVATMCHLGNIARWLGRNLQWDPEKEIFPNDAEANNYLDRPKRKPYEIPNPV